MTTPAASATITTAGPNPLQITMPASLTDVPGMTAVSHGRVFVRDAKGQYAENKAVFVDPTGTAMSADAADLHAAAAEATAALADAKADLADAHTVITSLVAQAKAIPADIKQDADGIVTRLEKWIKRVL